MSEHDETALRAQLDEASKQDPVYSETLHTLGERLVGRGALAEAEESFRAAYSMRKVGLGVGHPNFSASLQALAGVLDGLGRKAEAEALLKSALIEQEALGENHASIAGSASSLAGLLANHGDPAGAEPLLRRALKVQGEVVGEDHTSYGALLHGLASVVSMLGRGEEAEELLRRSMEIDEKAVGTDHPSYGASLHALGVNLAQQGRPIEALPLVERALEIMETALGTDHAETANSALVHAQLLQMLGRPEGEEAMGLALRKLETALGADHPRVVEARGALAATTTGPTWMQVINEAQARLQQGEADEVVELLQGAMASLDEAGAESAFLGRAMLARALLTLGRVDEAAADLEKLTRLGELTSNTEVAAYLTKEIESARAAPWKILRAKGVAHLRAGRSAEAAEALSDALASVGEDSAAEAVLSAELAQAQMAMGDMDAARQSAQKALDITTASGQTAQSAQIKELIARIDQVGGNPWVAGMTAAMKQMQAGDLDGAITRLRALLAIVTTQPAAYAQTRGLLAQLLHRQGDPEGAQAELEAALAVDPPPAVLAELTKISAEWAKG